MWFTVPVAFGSFRSNAMSSLAFCSLVDQVCFDRQLRPPPRSSFAPSRCLVRRPHSTRSGFDPHSTSLVSSDPHGDPNLRCAPSSGSLSLSTVHSAHELEAFFHASTEPRVPRSGVRSLTPAVLPLESRCPLAVSSTNLTSTEVAAASSRSPDHEALLQCEALRSPLAV